MPLPEFFYENENGIPDAVIDKAIKDFATALLETGAKKIIIIPPDFTRSQSGAGRITRRLYAELSPAAHCDLLPALGTHRPMNREERLAFFGDEIPEDRFLVHDFRRDTVTLGEVPADFMSALSEGRMCEAIPVEMNRRVAYGGYDAVLSVGQVVPHEVAGMANYSKNILVGCGGYHLIDASHMLSVFAGTEKWIGCDHSPVRKLFDYAQTQYLDTLPLSYILTVTTPNGINGLYSGGPGPSGRAAFEKAVALSQKLNITHTKQPVQTCVVRLPKDEFRSAWLGNKAVYRTRKALADQARLVVLAPGFERFGEDAANDGIIRRYGYRGRDALLPLLETETVLQQNRGALAHLFHGSSDGAFSIRYCTPPAYAKDIQSVGYEWGDIDEYEARYAGLTAGWNRTPDGDVYVIDNPALGLWVV